jgi:hypothetical protein
MKTNIVVAQGSNATVESDVVGICNTHAHLTPQVPNTIL